jgi:hypothetical protein
VPGLINYQGTLTDSAGVALDTTVSMIYSIYTDSIGGTMVWTETQSTVVVSQGIYNVLLGSVNAISDTVFKDPERWLGVQVGGDPELAPRQRIAAVGYALRATGATTDGDWTISGDDVYHLTGNVGIGTSSPTGLLHVYGGAYPEPVLRVYGAEGLPGTYGPSIYLQAGKGGLGTEGGWVTIDAGYGGDAPIPLSSLGGSVRITGGNGGGYGTGGDVRITGGGGHTDGDVLLAVDYYGSPQGNVGIGTLSPLRAFHYTDNLLGTELLIEDSSQPTGTVGRIWRFEVSNLDWRLEALDDDLSDSLNVITATGTGHVGIGTTSPEAILHVNGTVKMFGSWASKSFNTIYQATTDGFVTATIDVSASQSWGVIEGHTDSSSNPTTVRVKASVGEWTNTDWAVKSNSFTMPVRKGDYWKVTRPTYGGTAPTVTIYWIPLGV